MNDQDDRHLITRRQSLVVIGGTGASLLVSPGAALAGRRKPKKFRFTPRHLDGGASNLAHPSWGKVGVNYRRLAPARYADGIGAIVDGPNPRYISNRIFNSLGVDLFSERNVSQWVWVWGQFLDHTFGLAEGGTEDASIPFSSTDPLEGYTNTLGPIPFTRNAVAPGTGTSPSNPRQQINTVNSYIDGWPLYGGSHERLAWLRSGPDDGKARGQGGKLLLPGGYLPRASARGDVAKSPTMQLHGKLTGNPAGAVVAGDVRANENDELTALQTLFAREHNRIVGRLPRHLSSEEKFQIARRIVGAEEQYITYREFLPAVGVKLAPYRGYQPHVNTGLWDEFATVGYRAHSMVNGEVHINVAASRYTPAQIATLEANGVAVTPLPGTKPPQVQLDMTQGSAFFNPDLVSLIGLGPILEALGKEPGYKNDEQIDDSLRSVLFLVPPAGVNPAACFSDPATAGCFQGVVDLGAIDIQRSRDNGTPTYNELREALGLAGRTSFTEITGEVTEALPSQFGASPPGGVQARGHGHDSTRGLAIDNPQILAFTQLLDLDGKPIPSGSTARAAYGTRATTLVARLKGCYGTVDNVDAFVGMACEPHVSGTEFGELQLALWTKQFTALRDGDRFFYANDPVLPEIHRQFGITYKHTLAKLIALNTEVPHSSLQSNVFFAPPPARATQAVGD
jgi:hypothetical protein